MYNCAGRILSPNIKLYVTNRAFTPKLFSTLYSCNHKVINSKSENERYKYFKTNEINSIQSRKFSMQKLDFYSKLAFDSITSAEISKFVRETVVQVHDITGLSWWSVIVLSAVALRLTIGLPSAAYQHYLLAKLKHVNAELEEISRHVKDQILYQAKKEKWTKARISIQFSREMKKYWSELVVKNNCHPFKATILSTIQLPIWIIMSLNLRKYCNDVKEGAEVSGSMVSCIQFQVGGPFWCPNLVVPDPTLILPAIITITSLLLVELNLLSGTHALNLFHRVLINIFKAFAFFSFIVAVNVPAGVTLYWAASIIMGLLQSLLLLSPKFRRFCRIPKTPKDLTNPYKHVINKFKEKWSRRINKLKSL